jgi:hypothetical protein
MACLLAAAVLVAPASALAQKKMTIEELLKPYDAKTREPPPEAQPAQPTGIDWVRLLNPDDKSDETQHLRLLILFSFSVDGVIDRHEGPLNGEARLFVRPSFNRLTGTQKEQLAALAFLYHWDSDRSMKVVIREAGSGRKLGEFTIAGMLRLDY